MLLIYYLQKNVFLRYTDRTPITYQVWNNYLIKNQKFQIELREGKKGNLSHRYFYKTYFEKIKIAQSRLQPELQNGNDNCVLMVTAVLTETFAFNTLPKNNKSHC